jgi:hypothetical protein
VPHQKHNDGYLMARIRTLKPEFFRSPDTASVDFPVRIFYQALWCWADDFGIGETNLHGLLGFAFPDEDGFTAQDLRRFCADVAKHFAVTFYTVRGRHYYAIQSWEKHQKLERRNDRRKHPTPDDPDAIPDQRIHACADSAPTTPRENGAESRISSAGTGEQGNRGTGELEKETTPPNGGVAKKTAARGTRLPDGWTPPESVVAQMRSEHPHVDLKAEHAKFIDYWQGKAGAAARKADWSATWRNWIRRAAEDARPRLPAIAANDGIGKPTQKALGYQDAAERIIARMENQP